MSENSGYATFVLYHTLHLHFSSKSYDYFKYHGKCNIGKDAFLNRRDKYIFYAISRKYNLQDAKNFFIANLLEDPKAWIGQMNSAEGDEIYKQWQKRNQSLTYVFENDIIHLLDRDLNPNDIFSVKNGQEPLLLKEVYYGNVCIETLIILKQLLGFWPMWQEKINDDIVFPTFAFKVMKYEPFVSYDVIKFKKILQKLIKEHINNDAV